MSDSDRSSDDIKQLFGHLGLDPRSYREIKEQRSAPAEPLRKPEDWSLLKAVQAQLAGEQGSPPAEHKPPPEPPAPQARLEPSVPPTAPPDPAPPAAAPPPPAPPAPPAASAPAPAASPGPASGGAGDAPLGLKDSLLASLRQFGFDRPDRRAPPPVAAPPAPSVAPPSNSSHDMVTELPKEPYDWQNVRLPSWPDEIAAPSASAAESVAMAGDPTPSPTPSPDPASPPPPPASPIDDEHAGLASTFRRLQAPRQQANPELSKLRLNYGPRSEAHGLSAPRESSLKDVFARLRRIADGA